MGLMGHGVQCQPDAVDLVYPCPGGDTIKQASPEHVVDGSVAPLVNGVSLGMVGRGE